MACVLISELSDGPRIVEEYAAHADEGVRIIRTRLRHDIVNDRQGEFDIWTAGDDGLARRLLEDTRSNMS